VYTQLPFPQPAERYPHLGFDPLIGSKNGVEHILAREAAWHPDSKHRDDIIDLSWRQPCAFEGIAIGLTEIRRNSVVECHALLTAKVSPRVIIRVRCKKEAQSGDRRHVLDARNI
jgi:hypothetical protein